jgi:hypothetical protein
MGGYDLYGTYYPNTQDALNAEIAQMAQIDARQAHDELEKSKYDYDCDFGFLHSRIEELEKRVDVLEKRKWWKFWIKEG